MIHSSEATEAIAPTWTITERKFLARTSPP